MGINSLPLQIFLMIDYILIGMFHGTQYGINQTKFTELQVLTLFFFVITELKITKSNEWMIKGKTMFLFCHAN